MLFCGAATFFFFFFYSFVGLYEYVKYIQLVKRWAKLQQTSFCLSKLDFCFSSSFFRENETWHVPLLLCRRIPWLVVLFSLKKKKKKRKIKVPSAVVVIKSDYWPGADQYYFAKGLNFSEDVRFDHISILTYLCIRRQTWENSVDPDQTQQNTTSDQDLHC